MYMSSKVWSYFLRDVVCHSVSRPIGVLRLINFMTEVTCQSALAIVRKGFPWKQIYI